MAKVISVAMQNAKVLCGGAGAGRAAACHELISVSVKRLWGVQQGGCVNGFRALPSTVMRAQKGFPSGLAPNPCAACVALLGKAASLACAVRLVSTRIRSQRGDEQVHDTLQTLSDNRGFAPPVRKSFTRTAKSQQSHPAPRRLSACMGRRWMGGSLQGGSRLPFWRRLVCCDIAVPGRYTQYRSYVS